LKASPEDIAVAPKPRMIPVLYTRAAEIADILRQVYIDRMVDNPNQAMNQPMGPMQLFARGMMRQQQQGAQAGRDDVVKLSLGVDTKSNSLIVAAPDPLFEEVKELVGQLDVAAADQDQMVRVVTLHRTSAAAVGRALEAMGGDSVQVNGTSQTATSPSPQSYSSQYRGFGQQQGYQGYRGSQQQQGYQGYRGSQQQQGYQGYRGSQQQPGYQGGRRGNRSQFGSP
jgi:hypothetical protein